MIRRALEWLSTDRAVLISQAITVMALCASVGRVLGTGSWLLYPLGLAVGLGAVSVYRTVGRIERAARRRRPEHLEPLDLSQIVEVDAILHPHGRCECCGEGRCDFCAWARSVETMSEAEEVVLARAKEWHAEPAREGAATALRVATARLAYAEAAHEKTLAAGALEETR